MDALLNVLQQVLQINYFMFLMAEAVLDSTTGDFKKSQTESYKQDPVEHQILPDQVTGKTGAIGIKNHNQYVHLF